MKKSWTIHLVGGATLLALTALAWFPLAKPAFLARSHFKTLVSELEVEQTHLHDLQTTVRAQQSQLSAVQQSLTAQPLSLKAPEELNSRLEAISELALLAGFQVDSLEAGRQDTFDQYGVVELRIAGKCRYPALQHFLQLLLAKMPDMALGGADVSGRYSDRASAPTVSLKLRWHTTARTAVALP